MRILEREAIDTKRWDQLVESANDASFFSMSWYLDSVAEQWCVLVDEDYSAGIALPFTKRFGVKILYVPIFSRYSEAIGSLSSEEVEMIRKHFDVCEIATSREVFPNSADRVFQKIEDWEQRKISSQGKRSLNKAKKQSINSKRSEDFTRILEAVQSEISGKFDGVDDSSLKALGRLFAAAQREGVLRAFEVSDGTENGGVVCLESESRLLYLKGACPHNLKSNGGMYLALNEACLYAESKGLTFDFGGSNVEGVRRFNGNLGGVDQQYAYFEQNNAPFWFKLARNLKRRVR